MPDTVNPYRGREPWAFWSSGVAGGGLHSLDPVVDAGFRITPETRVATMGSCFAQHISRQVVKSGFNYFVPETGPDRLTAGKRLKRNYGVFSARYGNVYTIRQACQLLERAFGGFAPIEDAWRLGERWVDPFRPTVEPNGFSKEPAMRRDRDRHLAATQRVFREAEVLVLTLGLTEAWVSRRDGAVFGAAPGVAGGSHDPAVHEFVNFSVGDTLDDLDRFAHRFREINPDGRILLTVSPVPLVATYENRHVLVSTTASKAILRAAADQAARIHDHVEYFPSYEIITAPGNSRYFADDLRSVTPAGVAHVMRVLKRHYFEGPATPKEPAVPFADGQAVDGATADIICDEELMGPNGNGKAPPLQGRGRKARR